MAITDPVTIARWVIASGWTSGDRAKAVAVALASGADPGKPAGLFGVGTTGGDGPGQTRHAHQLQAAEGWDAFPASRTGVDVLLLPIAAAAVATASAAGAVAASPVGDAAEQAADAVTAPGRAVANLSDTTTAFLTYFSTENAWKRGLKFGIGVILITISAAKLVSGIVVKPALSKVGDVADTLIAGTIVKEKAAGAANSVRRSTYRGRHSAEGYPIRSSDDTQIAKVDK